MRILALDTAGRVASCALCADGIIAAMEKRDSMLDHSRTLLALCQEMLVQKGIDVGDVDIFSCIIGPGSFTGIRIGMAAVKGFGWINNRPCIGISSLLATAYSAPNDGVFCCRITARENEYYYAFFDKRLGRVTRLTPDAIALADEIERQMTQWQGCIPLTDAHNAAGAALAAWDMAAQGQLASCHTITPVYLRRPQAERLRLERLEQEKNAKNERTE